MKKSHKLLKLLYKRGSFDDGSGVYSNGISAIFDVPKNDIDNICKELIEKGYIDANKYRDLSPFINSKVIVTEKGKDFVTDYINKPWITKREIDIKNHKRVFIVGGLLIVLIVYLVSGCKITDGFSAIDCTKTLIQK